jgi:drug/metabolite transporter (DMT)-like permease
MIGSALFALGSAPGVGALLGTEAANLSFFVGAWFFTSAGLIQLFLSGPVADVPPPGGNRAVRAAWLAAATQSFGTVLFNVSTAAALADMTAAAQERFVWRPDAAGSVAFLVSGVIAYAAYARGARFWDVRRWPWWSVAVNLMGCIAFALSAVGAFILPSGEAADVGLATGGTFIGALCFFLASLIVLPSRPRREALPA